MCQKQFGAFYGPLVTSFGVAWTRGAPKWFQSSNRARRGFCADCGTPLTYQAEDDEIELAIGAFDDPACAAPAIQVNPNDKLSFVDGLPALHMRTDAEAPKQAAFNAGIVSHQHPDRDTAVWPPAEGFAR